MYLGTVVLSITRNCPCVVSRSQQNNSRSRFVSFPSPQCRIRAVSLGLELHVSGARRCLARGSQEHGGQRRALVVGDGVCVGGERQQRAVVASALAASGGSEWRRWRLREQWTGGGRRHRRRTTARTAGQRGRRSWTRRTCLSTRHKQPAGTTTTSSSRRHHSPHALATTAAYM